MREFAVLFDSPAHLGGNWSAHVPDLPGCYAVGDTREECEADMASAIAAHIEALEARGLPVPEPSTVAGMVAVR